MNVRAHQPDHHEDSPAIKGERAVLLSDQSAQENHPNLHIPREILTLDASHQDSFPNATANSSEDQEESLPGSNQTRAEKSTQSNQFILKIHQKIHHF